MIKECKVQSMSLSDSGEERRGVERKEKLGSAVSEASVNLATQRHRVKSDVTTQTAPDPPINGNGCTLLLLPRHLAAPRTTTGRQASLYYSIVEFITECD